jgi:hypothetical protein
MHVKFPSGGMILLRKLTYALTVSDITKPHSVVRKTDARAVIVSITQVFVKVKISNIRIHQFSLH